MRVLVCDQESEMLESVARWFEVDTATSKVTCIDLMRANPFDVVIASERLSDGSGLELLSHVATRWPDTLRVLVIEPARLKLLRGKLGPFRLHATMRYPIEEDELETVLNRMGELMVAPDAEEEPEPEPAPEPPPPPPQMVTTKVQKVTLPSRVTQNPSLNTRRAPPAATGRPAAGSRSPGQMAPGPAASGYGSAGRVAPGYGDSGHGAPSRGASGQATSSRPAAARPTSPSTSAPKATARSAKAALPLGAPVPPEPPTVRRKLGNYTPLGAPEDEQMRIVEREFDRTAAPLAARAMRAREEASRPRSQKEKLGGLASHLSETLKKLLRR